MFINMPACSVPSQLHAWHVKTLWDIASTHSMQTLRACDGEKAKEKYMSKCQWHLCWNTGKVLSSIRTCSIGLHQFTIFIIKPGHRKKDWWINSTFFSFNVEPFRASHLQLCPQRGNQKTTETRSCFWRSKLNQQNLWYHFAFQR